MRRVLTPSFIAVMILAWLGFTLLFRGITFNFWLQMTLTALILCSVVWLLNPREFLQRLIWPIPAMLPDILIGLFSAAILYGIFWVGNLLSQTWFGFAGPNIAAVYGLKGQTPIWLIGLLIGGIIGPGEEIFWRGWVQTHLEKQLGWLGVFFSIAAYASVHLASFNIILILAAGVCGAFWGTLYYFRRSLPANIISHIAWDLAVFLFFPFST